MTKLSSLYGFHDIFMSVLHWDYRHAAKKDKARLF